MSKTLAVTVQISVKHFSQSGTFGLSRREEMEDLTRPNCPRCDSNNEQQFRKSITRRRSYRQLDKNHPKGTKNSRRIYTVAIKSVHKKRKQTKANRGFNLIPASTAEDIFHSEFYN